MDDIGIYDFYSEMMYFLQFLQKWLIFGIFLQNDWNFSILKW